MVEALATVCPRMSPRVPIVCTGIASSMANMSRVSIHLGELTSERGCTATRQHLAEMVPMPANLLEGRHRGWTCPFTHMGRP